MVDAAEIVHTSSLETHEEYGRSLSAIRSAGRLALEAASVSEYSLLNGEVFNEYATAVAEMLKTDPEFRGKLDIDNRREHQIIDGQVRNADGETMVQVLNNGANITTKLAESNPAYEHQAIRDKCDIELAERVDAMAVGKTMWGVSMYPKEGLHSHPDIYKKRFGYKEGLVYIQTYYKVDEHSILTGSYSVDAHDPAALRQVLARHGLNIPEAISDDTWLSYSKETELTSNEADEFARSLRNEFYRLIGATDSRFSISEFMKEYEVIIQSIFNTYYPELAKATYSKQSSPVLRTLAQSILTKRIHELKPEVAHQLKRVAHSSLFDDESAKTMDSIIRYAAVEELRKLLSGANSQDLGKKLPRFMPSNLLHPAFIHELMANNLQAGISAGRSYGGCPGNIELSSNKESNFKQELLVNNSPSLQETYGGKASETLKCVTCPLCNKEGVDAHITYNGSEKTIKCSSCKQSKTY